MTAVSPLAQSVIDAIRAELPAWQSTASPIETPTGDRYTAADVSRLLTPALAAVGFHSATDGVGNAIFALDGEPWSVARLRSVLAYAAAYRRLSPELARSLALTGPYEETLPLLPGAPVSILARAAGAGLVADAVRGMLTPTPLADVYASYLSAARRADIEPLGQHNFSRAAVQTGLVSKRRRSFGNVLIPSALDA